MEGSTAAATTNNSIGDLLPRVTAKQETGTRHTSHPHWIWCISTWIQRWYLKLKIEYLYINLYTYLLL